jgi:hypothetical protein
MQITQRQTPEHIREHSYAHNKILSCRKLEASYMFQR